MGILGRFTRRKAAPPQSTSPSLEEKPSLSDDAPDANADDLPHVDGRAEMAMGIDAIDVMADRIFRSCSARGWFGADESKFDNDDHTDEVVTGVCIRSKYGAIRSYPPDHPGFQPFEDAVGALNPRVAIKMRSKAVQIAVKNHIAVNPDLKELFINANTRIQILATTEDLCLARKSQYAAFVRAEGVLVVWADRVEDIVATASALEESLVDFIWSDEADLLNRNRNRNASSPTSPGFDRSKERFDPLPSEGDGSSASASASASVDCEDPEKEAVIAARKVRPVALIAPAATGLAAALAVVVLSLGVRALLIRYLYDKNAVRFALAAVLPPSFLMIMFPSLVVVFSLLHLFGPVAQYHQNSATYSAVAPVRDPSLPLLPITVQLPVYKESLEDVIMPTLESVQRATTVFERQGGAVNVIVCDDGLQLLDEEDRARRIKFYTDHNVGYVARPPHGVDGFERRGRFKKAGNLNHCNALSLRVEDIMDEMRVGAEIATGQGPEYWTELDERDLYDAAFARALEETDSKTWAQGNIRIGEIILLIDSDTRVPEDCFMDASMEMTQSPHVAIIQHASGVMQVAHHFFENGVAFFTRNLQVNISFTASSGDSAPFVGHNAFLRWSALQECATTDPFDGVARIWSESHVSEDFQISLRLQSLGWTLRWATYSNNGFEEGVSLTHGDELARWQKYAWGCSEIIFNPIRYWPTRGPLSKLFRTFLWSNIPPHAKFGIMAYIFSYYAISLACTGSIYNYVLVGMFALSDTFYCSSWNVLFVCLILFQGVTNVVLCVLRYRLSLENAGAKALEQIKWIPFFMLFFGGLSLPVTQSLLSHLLSINMSWTTTAKSVVKSNFFLQVPRIWKRFWFQIVVSVVIIAGMIVTTTTVIPVQYRVTSIEAIVPLSMTYGFHLLWPFVLDSDITTFTF